jgi:hypothetical protein
VGNASEAGIVCCIGQRRHQHLGGLKPKPKTSIGTDASDAAA